MQPSPRIKADEWRPPISAVCPDDRSHRSEITPCPVRVKLRRAQSEQMSSQLPLKADMAQQGLHFAFVPNAVDEAQYVSGE
jgi:hypothetical protein